MIIPFTDINASGYEGSNETNIHDDKNQANPSFVLDYKDSTNVAPFVTRHRDHTSSRLFEQVSSIISSMCKQRQDYGCIQPVNADTSSRCYIPQVCFWWVI